MKKERKQMLDREFLEDTLKRATEKEVDKAIDAVIERAKEDIEKEIRSKLAGIVIGVSNMYSVRQMGETVIIEVNNKTNFGEKQMTQETELKPCPFCGGEATAWELNENAHYIGCKEECIPSFDSVYHEDDLMCQKQWNTRAEDPSKAELIEALKDMVSITEIAGFERQAWAEIETAKEALEKAKGSE